MENMSFTGNSRIKAKSAAFVLAFVVAVCYLALAVSCGKKEQEPFALEGKTSAPASEAPAPVTERVAPQPRQPEPEPEPDMQVEIDIPAEESPRPARPQPPRKVAAQPAPVAPPPPPPPPEPEPEPPRITVESISGAKVVTVGRPLALTGNTWTEGEGKADGFSWRFRNGNEVIERRTERPQVEVVLNKPGEWSVTCGVLWRGKTISNMTIRVNAVAAEAPAPAPAPEPQQDGMAPSRRGDVGMAVLVIETPIMLAYNGASGSDVVSDAMPMMLMAQAAAPTAASPPGQAAATAAESAPAPEIREQTSPDTITKAAVTPQAIAPGSKIEVRGVTGTAQALAGRELIVKCDIGEYADDVKQYVWRFRSAGGEVTETRTSEPQTAITFERVGDYAVTCDIVTGSETFPAQQQFVIKVVSGEVSISAGGPYSAMMGRPVKVLGNAASNASEIVGYEWSFEANDETPPWSAAENAVVERTFARSGEFKAVYKVTLADGSSVADTAVISVGSMMPSANAGADVLSYPGRRVRLSGTGSSPDGSIVKYEWDFNGSGEYDWSSERSGVVTRKFKVYSHPVLRVTDTEGNTATDTARVIICPRDMVTVEGGKFCVDRYEWPNRRRALPTVGMTLQEASYACAGVGKRLCSADEWQRACRDGRGPEAAYQRPFPYGMDYDRTKCNTVDNPRGRNGLVNSGRFGGCSGGAIDAYDMSGNAAEWVAPEGGAATAFGGFFQSGADASGCDSRLTLENDTQYLYVGFRCCK